MYTAIVRSSGMGPQGETEGRGKGQTDWADLTLTGKPAGRCVSGGSMYFANFAWGASTSTRPRLHDLHHGLWMPERGAPAWEIFQV